MLAESAFRVVKENIRLQRAAFNHPKPQCLQASPDFSKLVLEPEFDLDFDLHI
jgi:hypothetical protein